MTQFISVLEPGTVLMFFTISDLSSDYRTALYLYKKMNSEGIQLKFLKEPWLNNEIYISTLVEYPEMDEVVQRVLRATFEKINNKNS